jgi:hypothetical protein
MTRLPTHRFASLYVSSLCCSTSICSSLSASCSSRLAILCSRDAWAQQEGLVGEPHSHPGPQKVGGFPPADLVFLFDERRVVQAGLGVCLMRVLGACPRAALALVPAEPERSVKGKLNGLSRSFLVIVAQASFSPFKLA